MSYTRKVRCSGAGQLRPCAGCQFREPWQIRYDDVLGESVPAPFKVWHWITPNKAFHTRHSNKGQCPHRGGCFAEIRVEEVPK